MMDGLYTFVHRMACECSIYPNFGDGILRSSQRKHWAYYHRPKSWSPASMMGWERVLNTACGLCLKMGYPQKIYYVRGQNDVEPVTCMGYPIFRETRMGRRNIGMGQVMTGTNARTTWFHIIRLVCFLLPPISTDTKMDSTQQISILQGAASCFCIYCSL